MPRITAAHGAEKTPSPSPPVNPVGPSLDDLVRPQDQRPREANRSLGSTGSLDYLIRPQPQRQRDRQAEGLGDLEVDGQLALRSAVPTPPLKRRRGGTNKNVDEGPHEAEAPLAG